MPRGDPSCEAFVLWSSQGELLGSDNYWSAMHIIEIYKSLQGESSFAGLPCIFVRLAGCNLRCAWCDSEYTFSGGRKLSGG